MNGIKTVFLKSKATINAGFSVAVTCGEEGKGRGWEQRIQINVNYSQCFSCWMRGSKESIF